MRQRPPVMERVVSSVKSISWLADELGISKQAVSNWDQVPVEYLLHVERLTGIPREDLHPDLFQGFSRVSRSAPDDVNGEAHDLDARPARQGTIARKTKETDIRATVNLDGTGAFDIATGIGFLDHMLEQLSRHSLIDVALKAVGDLHIDFHHTTEDTGIVLGQAVAKALGDKQGIARYADVHLPMDETLTRVAIDFSGRPYLVWKVQFPTAKLGDMDTELFREWFQAFAQHAGLALHVETLHGENSHHIAETCYKGLARALCKAVEIDPRQGARVPSTKGTLSV